MEKRSSKKDFETERKFKRLVPVQYKRTQAPRLSAKGNFFYGMKKNLLFAILVELSKKKLVIFIDLDLSAAHSRIQRYLLDNQNSG